MDDPQIYSTYFTLAGAVINQAIADYKKKNSAEIEANKVERERSYLSAKQFLFSNQLQDYLKYFNIQGLVNVEKVRDEASRVE